MRAGGVDAAALGARSAGFCTPDELSVLLPVRTDLLQLSKVKGMHLEFHYHHLNNYKKNKY